jgi:hypothetical protein
MKTFRRYSEDDQDQFEWINGQKLLRDQGRVRVSLFDAVNTRKKPDDDPDDDDEDEDEDDELSDGVRVTDGQGGNAGLHKPGFRLAAHQPRVRDHYDSYDASLQDAHKTTRQDDPVVVNDGTDQRDAAYDAYDQQLRDAWRKP